MSENLRKSLGKSQTADKQQAEEARRKAMEEYAERDRIQTEENWRYWNDALEAYANGWTRPESRYWIVIDPDTPIATVEILQELAGLTVMPKVINTRYTGWYGDEDIGESVPLKDGKPKAIQAAQVTWTELMKVEAKTEQCRVPLMIWSDEHRVIAVTLVTSILKAESERENTELAQVSQ